MIIKDLLYILQIENYNLPKFLGFAYSHGRWWNLQKRNQLEWTAKMKLIGALTLGFVGLILAAGWFFLGLEFWWLIFPLTFLLPIFIAFAVVVIYPLDFYLKTKRIQDAKKVFQKLKGRLVVVGITGSYGKTSTKEILVTILGEKFKVAKIEGNINTDLGVAEYILKNRHQLKEQEIFIVEMGAYKEGEIKKIADLVQPDYSILTGITDCHLERFGSLENIISAKFELAQKTKKLVVLNFDDENIKNNFGKFSLKNYLGVTKETATKVRLLDDFAGIEFVVAGVKFRTKLLALHNISLILLAAEIAKELKMSLEEIAKGVEKIGYISHRLELGHNPSTNIWIIDDSYNGNYNGIASGVAVLSRAKGRKVVLTPGLAELGTKSKEIHRQIGKLYAQEKIDLVLLVKNQVVADIISGMKESGLENYKLYASTQAAHMDLANVLKSGDTIIFQNDWTDNYF